MEDAIRVIAATNVRYLNSLRNLQLQVEPNPHHGTMPLTLGQYRPQITGDLGTLNMALLKFSQLGHFSVVAKTLPFSTLGIFVKRILNIMPTFLGLLGAKLQLSTTLRVILTHTSNLLSSTTAQVMISLLEIGTTNALYRWTKMRRLRRLVYKSLKNSLFEGPHACYIISK